MLEAFTYALDVEHFQNFLTTVKNFAPIWVPILLFLTFLDIWLHYKQREWIKGKGSALLEIRLSKDMPKSPVAMELFLNTLYQSGVGNLVDVYIKGRVRTWFSLEIVSIGGQIHFYIWCQKDFKSRIETQLYAQFPTVEVKEVEDYAMNVHRDPEKINIGFIGQFGLTKKDVYPIKSYIDYGLDRDPKEEYKNDPLVSVLEYMGSLNKGEQAWIQILIQAHTKEGLKYGRLFTKPDWKKDVESEIKDILKKAYFRVDEEKAPSGQHLSEGQKNVISAIERTTGKNAFDTMIRTAYIAEKDVFNPANIGGIIGTLTQFNSNSLNGLAPKFKAGSDYGWQDPFGKKKAGTEKALLEAYKRRAFFNPPFKHIGQKPFIMTTEELATIFHFPGAVAGTPTLARIPSKKAEAPFNLPI